MFAKRVDKWLRLGAGSALLLLLIAQQKLCPWLAVPASEPEASVTDPEEAPAAPDESSSREDTAPQLPYLLPGTPAAAPRWPTGCDRITLQRSTEWHDGVVSCGPRDLSPSQTAFDAAGTCDPAWRALQVEPAFCWLPSSGRDGPAVAAVILTSITPTGPPLRA